MLFTWFSLILFELVFSSHLLFLKRYGVDELELDIPCHVMYRFINTGDESISVETLFDYTFYQSYFDASKIQVPKLETNQAPFVIGPRSVEELKFEILSSKTGVFQDLPAKVTYKVLGEAEEPKTSWSTVNGKMTVKEAAEMRDHGVGDRFFEARPSVIFFWSLSFFNVLYPAVQFARYSYRLEKSFKYKK